MRLTDEVIMRAIVGDKLLRMKDGNGLCMMIAAKSRVMSWRVTIAAGDAKKKEIRIGTYPMISIGLAREIAKNINSKRVASSRGGRLLTSEAKGLDVDILGFIKKRSKKGLHTSLPDVLEQVRGKFDSIGVVLSYDNINKRMSEMLKRKEIARVGRGLYDIGKGL